MTSDGFCVTIIIIRLKYRMFLIDLTKIGGKINETVYKNDIEIFI